jgi:signal transduction histidine kinase
MIAVEADRCRKIVGGLLDFARKRTRRAEAVELRGLLESVVAVLEKHDHFENVTIHLDLDPAVPPVDGDAGQLTQAFVNLASNAAEAMPDGGAITVSARAVGADRVEIAVRDEGVGIPQESMGQLFTPFFTTKQGGKGTGLGLSIVHGIVKMHDGDIRVDSGPGKGSTFTITLNIWREDEAGRDAQTVQALGRHEHSKDDTDR